MCQVSPASDQRPDYRTSFHCYEGTYLRFGFFHDPAYIFLFYWQPDKWVKRWHLLQPVCGAKWPQVLCKPCTAFLSFSLFSSFILLNCLHLKSSSVLINTGSLVINNYVKGSKRCHLLERDCMYTTKGHAHLNYRKNTKKEYQ